MSENVCFKCHFLHINTIGLLRFSSTQSTELTGD